MNIIHVEYVNASIWCFLCTVPHIITKLSSHHHDRISAVQSQNKNSNTYGIFCIISQGTKHGNLEVLEQEILATIEARGRNIDYKNEGENYHTNVLTFINYNYCSSSS